MDYNYNAQQTQQPTVQQPVRKININELTPGDTIQIHGKVAWSHISYLYEGAELAAENERKNKYSKFKANMGPHTRLSLSNAEIIETNPVAGQPSLLAQYLQQRMWLATNHPELGYHYDAISKLKAPPKVYVKLNPNQTSVDELILTPKEEELSVGLDVTIVLRVYKSKDFGNNGIAFDCVIINEEPRLFRPNSGNSAESVLKKLGLTVNSANSAPTTPAPAPVQTAPAPAVHQPIPAPAPMAQPNIAPPPTPQNYGGITYDPSEDPSRRY